MKTTGHNMEAVARIQQKVIQEKEVNCGRIKNMVGDMAAQVTEFCEQR